MKTHPQHSIRRFRQGADICARQAVALAVGPKCLPVISKQAVLGSHPQESITVLEQAFGCEVGQALRLPVGLEHESLRRGWEGEDEETEEHDSETERSTAGEDAGLYSHTKLIGLARDSCGSEWRPAVGSSYPLRGYVFFALHGETNRVSLR